MKNLFFTLPTAINFIIVFAGFYLTKRGTLEDSAANYVPIIQMMLISTVVACVHSIYSVTLSTFAIVLFATVIFNNKKMMQRIAGLAWTGWTAAILFSRFFSIQKESDIYFFSEIFVSAMIIITAYWLCGILIQYQNEKTK